MGFTIAIANQKGGVGKTSVSMLVAGALAAHQSVVVVDFDKQGSASLWAAGGKFPAPVVAATDGNLAELLSDLGDIHDIVIVDCPPSAESPVTRSALAVADLLLVPCVPSKPDMQATAIMLAMVNENYPWLLERTRVVLNMCPTVATAVSDSCIAQITQSWPTAKSRLHLLTAYREASILGVPLAELKGRGVPRAAKEVADLIIESMHILATANHGATTNA